MNYLVMEKESVMNMNLGYHVVHNRASTHYLHKNLYDV